VLNRLYRDEPARDFGPGKLKAVRQVMIDAGNARTTINSQIGRIRRMFRWAVSEELIPASVLTGLEAVRDLSRNRSDAVETDKVKPVPQQHIDAILKRVPKPVRGMIEFQLATGARPGEARILRACDLNTSGPIWEYRPATHKTEHHDQDRVILIGPKGQKVLQKHLTPTLDAYVFCPRGSAGARPYERSSYRNAITRACKAAEVPIWTPNQLRHNFATEARRHFGIEPASTAMGHASPRTTEIYAEKNLEAARAVIAKIG
jgi:integrase